MMRQRLSGTRLLPLVLLLALVPGCAPVTVRQTTLQNTSTAVQADVFSTGELSQLTQQVVRMAGLHNATQDPLGTFQRLDRQRHTDQDRDTQLAIVELALWHALQQEATQPAAAADWYLLAAARSYEFLFAATPNTTTFFDPRLTGSGAFIRAPWPAFCSRCSAVAAVLQATSGPSRRNAMWSILPPGPVYSTPRPLTNSSWPLSSLLRASPIVIDASASALA